MVSKYIIEERTMVALADAVRGMRYEKDAMTPSKIIEKIHDTDLGWPITVGEHINPTTGKWERPSDWPDIDALADQVTDDEDCVYLTYDLRKTPGYGWIAVYVQNATANTPFWVERGHVENGAFVVDDSYEQIASSSSNAGSTRFFRQDLDEADGDVQLWRVRSDSHIIVCKFAPNTTTTAQNFSNTLQPCVQRAGKLPYITATGSSDGVTNTYLSFGTRWLERDAIVIGKYARVTSLSGTWYNCINLQSLDVSKWETENWAVTSLSQTWYGCYSLPELDVSNWNTKNWAVTNMGSTWYANYSLRSLDLSGWDTSNWQVTTLVTCWSYCESLTSLNVKGWNTSNWAVTTLAQVWSFCRSLRFLDLSSWDTSNWTVTSLNSTWRQCHHLETLEGISHWNTENWAVTTLAYAFYAIYLIDKLDLSCWDTSNWAVDNLSYVFGYCQNLRELDISTWDTSNWQVTTLYYCFASMRSLKRLDISRWNTTNWKVTETRYLVTNTDCVALREFYTPEDLGIVETAANGTGTGNVINIEVCTGWKIYQNNAWSAATKLTHDSLVSILNRLATVTETRTITLGQNNRMKLSAEEIAIATQKGWTVA